MLHRLLQQALESAVVIAQSHFTRGEHLVDVSKGNNKMKSNDPHLQYIGLHELEIMLNCVEENSNPLLAERVLYALQQARNTVPDTMMHLLVQQRYV